MHNLEAVIDECFDKLSKEYEIEEVDSIPGKEQKFQNKIWKIQIPVLLSGKVEDIEIFLFFPCDFPYTMPYVILPDDRFRYLPHISVKSRKLCLYEEGTVFETDNIEGLIRDNITRTRRWIEEYYGKDNTEEYFKEIRSYWNEKYDEPSIDDSWLLIGSVPQETCELYGLGYFQEISKKHQPRLIKIASTTNENSIINYVKRNHKTYEFPVLFLNSLRISMCPPFNMTGQDAIQKILMKDDIKTLKSFLNRNGKAYVLFPIGLKNAIGGVFIPNLKTNRKGFRPGTLSYFKVFSMFGNEKKNLERLYIPIYSDLRIAERTAGKMMIKRNFIVAGLGSIGSNLCYFLNGYNNASFTLIDYDYLTIDNIGRHLLGFEYIKQNKSQAVANFLLRYRPDRQVKVVKDSLQNLNFGEIKPDSILYVCTGDIMSEKWLIDKLEDGSIQGDTFIFWLEPYSISGIMIYVNPKDKDGIKRLKEKAKDSFMDFCLIDKDEYKKGEKLIKRDAGCNSSYSLYSANDITLFLSSMFPIIDELIENPAESKCYRWIGNIEIAIEKDINLTVSLDLSKNILQELPF